MSILKVTDIQSNGTGFNDVVSFKNASGTQNGTLCRAWVNFQGTGTVTIRDDFNVSSITDHGTGDYTVNFSNAMSDANYSVLYTGGYQTSVDARTCNVINSDTPQTTSSVRLRTIKVDATDVDTDRCNAAIFR